MDSDREGRMGGEGGGRVDRSPPLTPYPAYTYDDSSGPPGYQRIPRIPRFPASLGIPADAWKPISGLPGEPRNMGNPGSSDKSGTLKTEARVWGFARGPARLRGLPTPSRTPPSPSPLAPHPVLQGTPSTPQPPSHQAHRHPCKPAKPPLCDPSKPPPDPQKCRKFPGKHPG